MFSQVIGAATCNQRHKSTYTVSCRGYKNAWKAVIYEDLTATLPFQDLIKHTHTHFRFTLMTCRTLNPTVYPTGNSLNQTRPHVFTCPRHCFYATRKLLLNMCLLPLSFVPLTSLFSLLLFWIPPSSIHPCQTIVSMAAYDTHRQWCSIACVSDVVSTAKTLQVCAAVLAVSFESSQQICSGCVCWIVWRGDRLSVFVYVHSL